MPDPVANFALPLGLALLLVAYRNTLALRKPQNPLWEWLFPLRGRWLRILLIVVPAALAFSLLGPCLILTVLMPVAAARLIGMGVERRLVRTASSPVAAPEVGPSRREQVVSLIAFAIFMGVLLKPASVSAIDPGGRVAAHASGPSIFFTLITGTGHDVVTAPFTRCRLEVIDRHTQERRILLDMQQDSVADWLVPSRVHWSPDGRTLTCVFDPVFELHGQSYCYRIHRDPLRATELDP